MSDDAELDPALRRKVAALYADEPLRLDAEAQARLIAAAQREGQRVARARRLRARAAFVAAALAAAAAMLLWIRGRAPVVAPLSARTEPAPACELPAGPSAPALAQSADGRSVLGLGRFGQLFAEAASELRIERASACELAIALDRGALAGDLHSLRPAVLRVRTPLGEVVIRGTRFAVRADGGFEVVLLSGAVDVLSPDAAPLRLEPGHALERRSRSEPARVAPVRPEQAQALERLLSGEPAPRRLAVPDAGSAAPREAKPEKSSAELLAAAEAERRREHLAQARTLYREAGARSDDDAEVALLRWARLELDNGAPASARDVLARHARRFPRGRLGTEAAWLEVRTLSALGRRADAREAARRLIERFPKTPQAEAAREILAAP